MVGTLIVKTTDGAEILVDGFPREIAFNPAGFMVAAGKQHTVSSVLKGETISSMDIKVRVGAVVEVELYRSEKRTISDITVPVEAKEPVGSSTNEQTKRGKKIKTAGWITAGIGVACLIGGGVTGGIALGKENTLKENCEDGCDGTMTDTIAARDALGTSSTILISVGAAVATAGVVMLIIGKKNSKKEQMTAVLPYSGRNGVGRRA